MATNISQEDFQKTALRLPRDLHARLHEAAAESGRSYNAEIIFHLQKALPSKKDAFHEALQANRERVDAAARSSFLKGFGKKTKAEEAPPAAAVNSNPKPPVTIKELASRIEMDVSSCRRYVLRLGYKPTKHRTPDSGYQLALTVTADEARAIQAKRASEGYCEAPKTAG